jgi:hypothetical protein
MLPDCTSFAANLESVIFWSSQETGINECIGDLARSHDPLGAIGVLGGISASMQESLGMDDVYTC